MAVPEHTATVVTNSTPVVSGSRIAVIGAGAAGLTAAYLLQQLYQVTLFERQGRYGGHAHTFVLDRGPDAGLPLDLGFMVFNDRNYATLQKLFAHLGAISYGDSEMSFGYAAPHDGFRYAINWSASNAFANRINRQEAADLPATNPAFVSLLKEVLSFCRQAQDDLQWPGLAPLTLGEYLAARTFSAMLVQRYLLPMGAAIWSTPAGQMLDFPAQTFLQFFANHGLLSLRDVPQWRYVRGGSQTYVQRLLERYTGKRLAHCPVVSIARDAHGVVLMTQDAGQQRFDAVVLATHADEALTLLADPSTDEQRLLGAWTYQKNHAIVHTDEAVMPTQRSAWASWNYTEQAPAEDAAPLSVTYHLNRLQGHEHTARQYFLTLNPWQPIAEAAIVTEVPFTHPTYTFASLQAQEELHRINGAQRTYYCGSYCGYGFHEDAVQSGAEVARLLGVAW